MEHMSSVHGAPAARHASLVDVPLFVDLDGTLMRSDSLYESLCLLCKRQPWAIALLPGWLLRGKAYFKAQVAARVVPDVLKWPYNEALVRYLEEQKAAGRRLVLATAANRKIAERVSEHLALFDAVIASDDHDNRSGNGKLAAIQDTIGTRAFSYAGNAHRDLVVWRGAQAAVLVDVPKWVESEVITTTPIEAKFAREQVRLRTYLKAIRVHQWLKNVLVLMPVLPVLRYLDLGQLMHVLGAFFAFSFCGSAVYIFNDLVDLESDRGHPHKRTRPFAAGLLSIATGLSLLVLFLGAGLLLASLTSSAFLAVLLLYLVVTTLYCLRLKQIPIVDVIVLASLYTVRVIGGAAATDLPLSFWILAFSTTLFLSLALVKRCAELRLINGHGRQVIEGRGYHTNDLQILQNLGVASGLMSVVVLGVYITAPTTSQLFKNPDLLGLLCVVLLYWICRVWIKAHRGEMHDDPVLFAARDRVSQYLIMLGAAIVAAAVWL